MEFRACGGNANSEITITQSQVCDGILDVNINYKLAQKENPQHFAIEFSTPERDIYSMWSPSMNENRTVGRDYAPRCTYSRLASGMPIHCGISLSGKNRITLALSDAATATVITSGVDEIDAGIRWRVNFFTMPASAIEEYNVTMRIDTRDIPYYDAIYDVVEWWETECGYIPAPVPEFARLPMNSLWYSYHQVLVPDEIVEQCRLSKPLGMDTVIIDDGWQTTDSGRGYAYCGDWEPERMPDMKGLVDRIHETGMKVILWYSVPFVGKHAKIYDEVKEFLLSDQDMHGGYCLDPRYKFIRERLINLYVNAVKDWGLDGLKLDFIDSFNLSEKSLAPDPRRDFESLDEAVDELMIQIHKALSEINPDIMIEFRQSYVGPSIRKYGNMLRVGDCPNDGMLNRRGVVDLRLTSGKTAVHSDMLMWHPTDTKENVAAQLAATLFGVPQISMRIHELSAEHYNILKHYLAFWREHREVLLDGKLTAQNPESFYSQVCSELDGEAVVVAYENTVVCGDYKKLSVVNMSSGESVYLKGMCGNSYRVVDCIGEEISRGEVDCNICEIKVAIGGMVFVD